MKHSAPRNKPRIPALAVAAIMILIPVFVTYYAFHKRLPFVSQYTDYVVVDNSVNLRGGSPVRIAGIDVGSVESATPDGKNTKIAFSLDSNALPLHKDATITVIDRLFLEGSYYLDLFPGSPSAPVAPEGFTVREDHTSTPVQAFQVLSTFDIATRSNLDQLLSTSNVAFSPRPGQPESNSGAGSLKSAIPQLVPVLKDTALVSRAFEGTHTGDVQNVLGSSADVATTLAQNSNQLADLVTGLDRASGALASSDGALAQSIVGLDQTLQEAPAALSAIDRSLPPVDVLARALTPSLKASPPLVTALTSTVSEVTAVVAPAVRQALITSLRTTLASFPAVLTELAKSFPVTYAVTQCLRTHVLPVINEEVPDGSLSTNEPVWRDFIHMLPSLAAASGDFDGNGPYIRNLLGAGSNSVQAGTIGSLPGIGTLVGTLPSNSPSGAKLQGTSPHWAGTLTAADFRPDVPCATQKVPNLAPIGTSTDLRPNHANTAYNPTVTQLRSALARATGKPVRSLP